MNHLYFLGTLVSYALLCVALFNFSLPGAILFGCASLVFTWLARQEMNISIRADTHHHDHRHLHHHGCGYSGPSPYMPDGSISPYATPEIIQRFHAANQIPQSLPPATLYLNREYRVVERPVVVMDDEQRAHERYGGVAKAMPESTPLAITHNSGRLLSRGAPQIEHEARRKKRKKPNLAMALLLGPPRS